MEKPTLEVALQNIQAALDSVVATKAQHVGLQSCMDVIKENLVKVAP